MSKTRNGWRGGPSSTLFLTRGAEDPQRQDPLRFLLLGSGEKCSFSGGGQKCPDARRPQTREEAYLNGTLTKRVQRATTQMGIFHHPLLLFICIIPLVVYAYPNIVKQELDLGLSQAGGGMAITDDDRYLVIAYGETVRQIDLATFALTSSQPPALSEDDDTDGNIGGIVFIPTNNLIYGAQDDGDVLTFDLDSITDTPDSTTIADSKPLSFIVADTSGSSTTVYVLDRTNSIIYIYSPASSSSPTTLNLKNALPNVTFSVLDMLFVPDTDELYLSTDAGRIFYMSGGAIQDPIQFDTVTGDDLVALAATPTGTKVYAVNYTTTAIEVISTSTHQKGTPITLTENSALEDIVVTEVLDPAGAVYGFVSGQDGVSVFDTSDDDLIDQDTTNDAGTDDPISTQEAGYLIASTDGYIYMSSAGGEIEVITDKPYITVSDVSYTDSNGDSATTLQSGGTATFTFQSDEDGSYDARIGGDIDESGSLFATGSITASTDATVTIDYDTSSSLLSEGANSIFIFVTDGDDLTGRVATTVTVDTPPDAVTIESTGFGNGRAYVTFSRLTASDIDYYNIYADEDAAAVQTKAGASATADQPSSGSTVTGTVSGLTNGTTYYIAIEAIDTNGNIGPRAFLLSDGTAASAVPQATVGPAGMSGETGGCALASAREITMSKSQCLILILMMALIIVWRIWYKQGWRGWAFEHFVPNKARRKPAATGPLLIIILGFGVLGFSAMTNASEPLPKWWSAEARVGFWMPTDNTTELFFDKCCNINFNLAGGFLYQGRYGAELGVGFMDKGGSALGSVTGGVSSDTFNLLLIPMETNLVWRIDYVERQIAVPYIKGGVDYVFFRENDAGNVVKGLKTGLHAAGGVQFLIDSFDSDDSLKADYGIADFYVIIEARYGWINSFGGSGLDLSGPTYSTGLLFEF